MCAPLLSFATSRPCLLRLLRLEALSNVVPSQSCQYSIAYRPILTRLPPSKEPFEEEHHPHYKPERFYSVSPGDVVKQGQYSIISKLGWGGNSTVWLAEDLHELTGLRYVAINFGNRSNDENRKRSLDLLRQLFTPDGVHTGHDMVRTPIDNFELTTKHGTHLCLVYPPLRMTLDDYRKTFSNGQMPLSVVKIYAFGLLSGLDHLHSICKVIHTGIVPQ